MQFGNYTKFIITYPSAFWKKKGFNGEVISDGSLISQPELFSFFLARKCPKIAPITCIFDCSTHKNSAALMVISAAKMATAWSDIDAEHRKSEIIESIVRYFNAPEARDYIDYYEKNWSNEFLIGGGPTLNVTSFGCMEDYTRGLREPFLNVHFAGAETAQEWTGTMEGKLILLYI
jgi:monoamine oxidase